MAHALAKSVRERTFSEMRGVRIGCESRLTRGPRDRRHSGARSRGSICTAKHGGM